MPRITIKQIEAFAAVADTGTFRRAAERLSTSQPNISARIGQLEAQLGRRLMQRDAGSVRLTPAGETLLDRARTVLRALDALTAAAGDDRLFDGVLRLGVTEMIVHGFLGPYLAALRARFPNVEIDLRVDFAADLAAALHDRGLDLALMSGPFDRQISGRVPLGDFPFAWVAAPALGLGGQRLDRADLARQPVLTHAARTLPHAQIAEHLAGPGPRVRLVASSNMAACLQMTGTGLGVACLPDAMIAGSVAEGALERLDYSWTPDPLRFEARYDAATAPHHVARAAQMAGRVAASDDHEI
ncbi:LysR family transcriptional regulator [Jannaschia ovalis]|uniref:LysR family transcriptional regulator n=1 Tax=Jannaschia ovalis TaxID=3038773 RepID=A0ABY8LFS2_9RHOB|nr:LysR family transcriptional regulator [Jannaschia sp. GRR-S6-38]WGH79248.1 LysR family transcriptional regulator [Jannaschia sp. GRR-S6-38]